MADLTRDQLVRRLFDIVEAMVDIMQAAHYKCELSTDECYDNVAPEEHDAIRRAMALLHQEKGGET